MISCENAPLWLSPQREVRGFSLVEAVISVGIAGLLVQALLSSVIVARRFSHDLPYDLFATQLNIKLIEEMKKEDYTLLGPKYIVGANAIPKYNSLLITKFDPDNPEEGPEFVTVCRFKGFGFANNTRNADSLAVDRPSEEPGWETNEWQGFLVMLGEGKGAGQCAYVSGITDDKLQTTRELRGNASLDWITTPNDTTYFEIGGGKTVEVTTSWTERGKTRSKTFVALLVRDVKELVQGLKGKGDSQE